VLNRGLEEACRWLQRPPRALQGAPCGQHGTVLSRAFHRLLQLGDLMRGPAYLRLQDTGAADVGVNTCRSMEATNSRAAVLQASASRLGAVAATLQLPQPDPSSGAPTAMMAGVTRRSTIEAAAPLYDHRRPTVT
jgi:hypothetical protein